MLCICPKCERPIRTGELVRLTVIAEFNELKSKISYSISKPIDALPETLVHHACMEGGERV